MASFVPSWQGEGSPAGGTSDYFKCALIQLEEEVAATQTEKAAVMAQHNLNDIDDCGLWWSLESLRETLESYRKEAAALAAEACETLEITPENDQIICGLEAAESTFDGGLHEVNECLLDKGLPLHPMDVPDSWMNF